MVLISNIIFLLLVPALSFLLSFVGGKLHSIGDVRVQYAYFVFKERRDMPMTANILINVFAPNIVLVFLYDVYGYLGWIDLLLLPVWVFPLLYFTWRWLLIHVVIDRGTFYNYKYEICMASASMCIALVIYYGLLSRFPDQSHFIDIDELREELAFAIILAFYSFIKYVISDRWKQENVVTEDKIEKYVYSKFDKFFEKFKDSCDINANNRDVWICLFSIMIFEYFNRNRLYRLGEAIMVRIGKKTSVGIMQVQSNQPLSDRQSILLAYDKLCEMTEKNEYEQFDESQVYELAIMYNPSEEYAENVTYIYQILNRYVMERYAREFFFETEEIPNDKMRIQKQIKTTSFPQMVQCLKDDVAIIQEYQEGDLFENLDENEHLFVEGNPGDWNIVISNLENVTLDFGGSRLWSKFMYQDVLPFKNCRNLTLKNVTLGHKGETLECGGDVLRFDTCENVVLENIDLYGCGLYGIRTSGTYGGTSVFLVNSRIHDCKCGAIYGEEASVDVKNSQIYNCGVGKQAENLVYADRNLSIKSSQIYWNRAEIFLLYGGFDVKYEANDIHDNEYRRVTDYHQLIQSGAFTNNHKLKWE